MARHLSVVLAILFGSMAKNHARGDSDLDIAVSTSAPLTVEERLILIEDLALAFGRPWISLTSIKRTTHCSNKF